MSSKDNVFESPFPQRRPDIEILTSDEPPFEVDVREMFWWFGLPEVGDHTMWAIYDPPDWHLASHVDMKAVRPANVHGFDCVEVDSVDYEQGEAAAVHPMTHYVRVTEQRIEYLAVISLDNGKRSLLTLQDEGFDEAWGSRQRQVRHTGRFAVQADGSYAQQVYRLVPGHTVEVMESCKVRIGERIFDCVRVLDVKQEISERDILIEAYISREGRTILCRRYNGRIWQREPGGDKPTWDQTFPNHKRIIIDGATFVHWYDCLGHIACGIDIKSV